MKRLVLLFVLLLNSMALLSQWNNSIYPQEEPESNRKEKRAFDREQKAVNWNFKMLDGKLYWQKVFEIKPGELSKAQDFFEKNIQFQKQNDTYIGKIIFSKYLQDGTPPNIYYSPAEIIFTVQFKDNRYRVTVSEITWVGTIGTVGLITITQQAALTMQDMLNTDGDQLFLHQYPCKHANRAMLKIFDYTYTPNNISNELLNQNF